ncbi:hypothetical protein J7M28_05025 [bacterium]|nr:hypothetical protein [bacterium]
MRLGLENSRLDLPGLCIFLLAFLIASSGVFSYFSFDDYIYLHRVEDHISGEKGGFFGPFLTFSPWLYYRPIPTMFWVILFSLVGTWPLPYILGVMLLFAGMAFYIYKIGELLGNRLTGVISGALVTLYFPIYGVACSRWSSSLQMELFLIAAGMFYLLRWSKGLRSTPEPRGLPIAGILLMVGAFLSKETALLAPLLLPVYVPKKRVIKLAAGLFGVGVAIFVLSRWLIPLKFPLPAPSFDIFVMFDNLEFYLRQQFMYYLPPTLILLGALARGSRQRYVWLAIASMSFFFINFAFGYSDAAHRLKFATCLAAVVYAFMKGRSGTRFTLVWTSLLILPPLSVHDTTVHQSAEAFMGFSIFLGIGVASQLRFFKRLVVKLIRSGPARFPVGNLFAARRGGTFIQRTGNSLRRIGAMACLLIALYAGYSIISINVRIGIPEARRMLQVSNLTRDVREFLCDLNPGDRAIHATNLPGLISVPDIPFDARLHGCKLNVDENLEAQEGLFVVSSEVGDAEMKRIAAGKTIVGRLARGPFEVVVYSADIDQPTRSAQ